MIFNLHDTQCTSFTIDGEDTCPFWTTNEVDDSESCGLFDAHEIKNHFRPYMCKAMIAKGFAVIPLALIELAKTGVNIPNGK